MSKAAARRRRKNWGPTIVVGLFSTFVGGLATFWFLYVRAPPPEEVCQHLIDLTYEEAGDSAPKAVDALVGRLEERCVEDKTRIMQLRDKIEYAKYAKCVMAADNLGDAERC